MGLAFEIIVALGNLCGVVGAAIFFKLPDTRRLVFPKKTELLVKVIWIVVIVCLGIGFLITFTEYLIDNQNVSACFGTIKYFIYLFVYRYVYRAPLNKLEFLARLDTRIRVKEFYSTMDEAQSEVAQAYVYAKGDGKITALPTLKEKDNMVYVVMYRFGDKVTTVAGLEIKEDDINYRDDLRVFADEDMDIGYTFFKETEGYVECVDYKERLNKVLVPKMMTIAGIPHISLQVKTSYLLDSKGEDKGKEENEEVL